MVSLHRSRPADSLEPQTAANDLLLAEAQARARLLLICSKAIDANSSDVLSLLPDTKSARETLLGTLHQLRRRLDVDRSIIEAALARWTLEMDDPPGSGDNLD